MRKLLTIISLVFLIGCTCLSQIPPQKIVYVDDNCEAVMPDITSGFSATDNCSGVIIEQAVPVGESVALPLVVTVTATDESGNTSSIDVTLLPLDTIPPVLQIDTVSTFWSSADDTMVDVYKMFENWVYNYPERFDSVMCFNKVNLPQLDGTLYYDDIQMARCDEPLRMTYLIK